LPTTIFRPEVVQDTQRRKFLLHQERTTFFEEVQTLVEQGNDVSKHWGCPCRDCPEIHREIERLGKDKTEETLLMKIGDKCPLL